MPLKARAAVFCDAGADADDAAAEDEAEDATEASAESESESEDEAEAGAEDAAASAEDAAAVVAVADSAVASAFTTDVRARPKWRPSSVKSTAKPGTRTPPSYGVVLPERSGTLRPPNHGEPPLSDWGGVFGRWRQIQWLGHAQVNGRVSGVQSETGQKEKAHAID